MNSPGHGKRVELYDSTNWNAILTTMQLS